MTKQRIFLLAIIVIVALVILLVYKHNKAKYGAITKVSDGLYEVSYDVYEENQSKVVKYMSSYFKGTDTGCTSIYKDGMLMRNLDWYIVENGTKVPELVVHTEAKEGRYATVGVAHDNFITDETYDKLSEEQKAIIPFVLTDGMNSEGLMFSQNVCPAQDGISNTYGTNPKGEDLCNYMLGRQLLDHCATVDEAIKYLQNSNVYMIDNGDGSRLESHFLVADKNRAVVIEFVDNKMIVLEQEDLPYSQTFITNHYLFNGGENTGHGMGYHRDAIVKENYESISDWKSGMKVLEKLKYTQAYTKPIGEGFWYDEYYVVREMDGKRYDFNANTSNSDPAFIEFIKAQQEAYNKDGVGCWWSNHSSVYDTKTASLHLVVGENYNKIYSFTIK